MLSGSFWQNKHQMTHKSNDLFLENLLGKLGASCGLIPPNEPSFRDTTGTQLRVLERSNPMRVPNVCRIVPRCELFDLLYTQTLH